jgi:hypothetical protein
MKRRIRSTYDSSAQRHLFEAQHVAALVKETELCVGNQTPRGRAGPEKAEEALMEHAKAFLVTFVETTESFPL